MERWEESTTINATAEQVYDYVSDFTNHADWSAHGLQVTKDDDGPVQVGSTYSTTAKLFGTQNETSTITDLQRPTLFGWDSAGGLGVVHHTFALESNDGVTTVTRSASFTQRSFLAKLFGGRIKKDLPAALRDDLAKIKARLEGAS